MRHHRHSFLLLLLLAAGLGWLPAQARRTCREGDLTRPGLPAQVAVDLELVRGSGEQEALPEWSKIEKLHGLYEQHAEQEGPCLPVKGGEIAVQLFIARSSLDQTPRGPFAGFFRGADALQFYGISRVKVERADQQVTREFAYPAQGPAAVSDVVGEDEEQVVLMEDLAQLRMVQVPRIKQREALGGEDREDCFLISGVTLVPSRAFDPPAASTSPSPPLTLNGRRLVLEQVSRDVQWLERLETEVPGCSTLAGDGYRGRQITSLNLTVRELVPELDFVTQAIRFWREVEQRVQQLRDEEQSWLEELSRREPRQ